MVIEMGTPQIILLVMIIVDAGGFLYRNAKSEDMIYNTGIVITAFFLKYISIVWVLHWGGFWNV